MKLILISMSEKLDISEYVTSASLSGDYRSASRTLDFGIIHNMHDPNIKKVVPKLGENVQVFENDKLLFHGIIWDRLLQTDSNELKIVARDFGIYLTKNKGSYNFSSVAPEVVAQRVCSDFGIETGNIEKSGAKISRKFISDTLYNIIMTAYSVANDKKYMCIFEGKKLNIIEKAAIKAVTLDASNLLTSSFSESLNEMINRVNIYNQNDKFIKAIESKNEIALYGVMTEHYKTSKSNDTAKAATMLKGVSNKIEVTNFGDISFISGKSVEYTDPFTRVTGLFYIDDDTHNWKNGIYTNKLTLNFQNLMDERAGGSNG